MTTARAFALAAFGALAALVAVVVVAVARPTTPPTHGAHECYAPCSVIVGDVQEDEFGIDYGWRDKRTAVVDVYIDGGAGR